MTYDLIVVGAGLSGMFAGVLAARSGLRTLVVARGHGGTHLGTGCIDAFGYRSDESGERIEVYAPGAAIENIQQTGHPLALAGHPAVKSSLLEFQALCNEAGYPLLGSLDHNLWLPTALGVARPTCLAPESFIAGDLERPDDSLALANLADFRDWHAHLAAANLRLGGTATQVIDLELPRLPARREMFSTDLARLIDKPAYRAEVADRWRPHLNGVTRLGLPAILGLAHAHAAWRDLSERLGIAIFEVPTLPPSVPGIRLFNVLHGALQRAGGRLILGPAVQGWIEDGVVRGVSLETAGGERRHATRHLILATGGFRHGGLEAPAPGIVRESVLGLPVETAPDWFAPFYWSSHPYSRFGVRVNAQMQPIDHNGGVIHANVSAIGGLLAGADRDADGCREALDLATAWSAIQHLSVSIASPLPPSAGSSRHSPTPQPANL